MRSLDRVSGTILLILSILICLGSIRYGFGSLNNPGPGFFPFVLGMVVGLLSLLIVVKPKYEKHQANGSQKLWPGAGGLTRIFCILLALVSYGILLEKLGYTLTTFIMFILLIRGIIPQKWYIVIGGALLASIGSYVLFKLALQIELPRGLIGI